MKNILFVLFAIMGFVSCGNKSNAETQLPTSTNQKEVVEVLYFHGKQRCITCNTIENLTREVVEKNYAQQLKAGKITFKVVDISTKEGEKMAEKYEVTWSSLYINKWNKGKETKNNMTDFSFSHAKNSPNEFKSGIKKKIDELLK